MKRILAVAFVAAASLSSGCIICRAPAQPVGPPPPPPPPTAEVVYYEEPPPQPVQYYETDVVWYYGAHPVPGGWCPIRGGHTHPFGPSWNDRYDFYNGYYWYTGDPWMYDRTVVVYVYFGAHPNPWGGWCYDSGEHRHYYPPRREHPYNYDGHVYRYSGTYDHEYEANRSRYDEHGHLRGNGYDEHHVYQ
ncbi:MAG TPA: hypothetical protein VMV18_12330, partial [bacterium]|nr:hypothetical protein [bacterium]